MGFRFRRSFKVFPGVRVNLSKSGLSTSFGGRGASINVSSRGVRGTVGIPGTGLSYSQKLTPGLNHSNAGTSQFWIPPSQSPSPNVPQTQASDLNAIASGPLHSITSPKLMDLRQMLIDAAKQKSEVAMHVKETLRELKRRSFELKMKSLLKPLFRKRIEYLDDHIPELRAHVNYLNSMTFATKIDLSVQAPQAALAAFSYVERAFEQCANSSVIWHIVAQREINQVAERSSASRGIDRKPVRFLRGSNDLVEFGGKSLTLENTNGNIIYIYPGFLVIAASNGEFALITIEDLFIKFDAKQFVETERVPPDSRVVGRTWFKCNKDGSPDRRFSNNFEIPICEYGSLSFVTGRGLNEEYQISNAQSAIGFGNALAQFRNALLSNSGPTQVI